MSTSSVEVTSRSVAELSSVLTALRRAEARHVEVCVPIEFTMGEVPKALSLGRELDIELAAEETVDLDATLPVS